MMGWTLLMAASALVQTPVQGPGAAAPAPDAPTEAYRVVLMRAAPGRLLDLIQLLEQRAAVMEAAGEPATLVMRHSQGDHWDLMSLAPIGSLEEYYSEGRREPEAELRDMLSWREELFAEGPEREALQLAARDAGLFHIEMFIALPGKYEALVEQRYMENAYYNGTERRGNFVFTRIGGAAWDVFTVGFYNDWAEFVAEPDLPQESFEQAARDAGFEARNRIGTYLRELILSHNDTLAGRAY
ncbi:MAG: hypothetical protein ABFS14_06150 [Gemmatimonadota bacterium]